jgi:hypothetical protein
MCPDDLLGIDRFARHVQVQNRFIDSFEHQLHRELKLHKIEPVFGIPQALGFFVRVPECCAVRVQLVEFEYSFADG